MTETLEEIRRKIDEMHLKLEEATYYELLELEPADIDEKNVMRQFRLKARDWHADRFSALDLDAPYRQKVQEIFSALNTASQVLSDPERRNTYDFELEAGDHNIENIIDAENAFRRGKQMLHTGSYRGAHEQFRRAVELHPEEYEYEAHFVYTEFLQIPKDEAGIVEDKRRAQEMHARLDEISMKKPEDDSILTFLGVVSMGLDQHNSAKRLFNEALQYNPRNIDAQRQLRLITMREERQANRGFFSKLLERFRS